LQFLCRQRGTGSRSYTQRDTNLYGATVDALRKCMDIDKSA
jgi:hypothetical protein